MGRGTNYSVAKPIETVSVDQLWSDFIASGKRHGQTRRHLINHYILLCQRKAEAVVGKNPYVTLEELFSAAYDGLERGLDKFDPAHGAKFETFIDKHLWGGIQDYLRSADDVRRSQRHSHNIYERWRWQSQLHKGTTRDPRAIDTIIEEDIGPDEGYDLTQITRIRLDANQMRTTEKTIRYIVDPDDDSVSPYDPGDAEVYSPNEPLSIVDQDYFLRILSCYPGQRERTLAFFYLFEEQTMKEVGMLADLGESRISQILTQIAWFFLDYMHKDMGGLPTSVFRYLNLKYGDLDGLYAYVQEHRIDVANGLKTLLMKVSYSRADDDDTNKPPEETLPTPTTEELAVQMSPERTKTLASLLDRLKAARQSTKKN